jgi:hypothetical protein
MCRSENHQEGMTMKRCILIVALGVAAMLAAGSSTAHAQVGDNGICRFDGYQPIPTPYHGAEGWLINEGGGSFYCPARYNSDVITLFQWKFTAWTTLTTQEYDGVNISTTYYVPGWLDQHGCSVNAFYRVHMEIRNHSTGVLVDFANSGSTANTC